MTSAVLEECLVSVVAQIKALVLTGIDDGNVVAMLVGDDQKGDGPEISGFPCVVVAAGDRETIEAATNLRDDVTYPILVALISVENRQATNRDRNLLWRQQVRRKFNQKRLPDVTGGSAWKCEVRPGQIADRPRWLQGYHAQVQIVAVTVRESRS